MLESSSSGNIMVNDPDKSFYVEFKPKADSSWQERGMPKLDTTILGFTESMMNLSVNEESKAFEEKKLNTIKRKNECANVITVLDSDEEKETKRDKKRVISQPVEQFLGQSYFRKIKQEPSEYDDSLDRFKMGNSRGEEDSKDTFKALDFELPETDISDSLDSTLWMDSSDITLERYESAKQEPGESKSAYFARLRRLARKHFDEEVKRQILEEEKAEAIKALSQFAKGQKRHRTRKYSKPCWDRKLYSIQKRAPAKHRDSTRSYRSHRTYPRPCRNCAKIHLPLASACPAYNKMCHTCGRYNHFSSVCIRKY